METLLPPSPATEATVVPVVSWPPPYVTHDAAGNLTGCYRQERHADHTAAIEVDDAVAAAWCTYRANAARTGVELAPPAPFDLPGSRARLIAKIDIDVDAVYAAVVGNRSDEYTAAASAAATFAAAGYTGTVPPSVQCWATAKGWTAKQAADDILGASANLTGLRENIRAQRLAKKEVARGAGTEAAVASVAAQWAGALAAIRAAAGL